MKKKPKEPEIDRFESAVRDEMETVQEITMYLWRYKGRVRARILAHVNELLAYVEDDMGNQV